MFHNWNRYKPKPRRTHWLFVFRLQIPEALNVVEHQPDEGYDHKDNEWNWHKQHRSSGMEKWGQDKHIVWRLRQVTPLTCSCSDTVWLLSLRGKWWSSIQSPRRRVLLVVRRFPCKWTLRWCSLEMSRRSYKLINRPCAAYDNGFNRNSFCLCWCLNNFCWFIKINHSLYYRYCQPILVVRWYCPT